MTHKVIAVVIDTHKAQVGEIPELKEHLEKGFIVKQTVVCNTAESKQYVSLIFILEKP